MPYEQHNQGDPLQLIEFARNKQLKLRRGAVHQSVPNPILIYVLGDHQRDQLDALYTQLTSRWSSQLGALQFCYCYSQAPYQGSNPILQAKVTVPADRVGAGSLCCDRDSLVAVNKAVSEAINRIGSVPQISMQKADIHVIMGAEDPIAPLLTDLVAVAQGWVDDFGTSSSECRLYLMLPQRYKTNAERLSACATLDQIRDMEGSADTEEYRQPVLMPQIDGEAREFRCKRLLNRVILLDEMDEKYRRYDQHGERLQLLGDLIETNWLLNGYILTAGAQEATAGPEYWLSHAVDTLCEKALREMSSDVAGKQVDADALFQEIEAAAPQSMPGYTAAMGNCYLFFRDRVDRITPAMPLEQAENGVFGSALESAFQSWLDNIPPVSIPAQVQQVLNEVDTDIRLEELADKLKAWAEKKEQEMDKTPAQSTCKGFKPVPKAMEEEKVLQLRKYLLDNRYHAKRNMAANQRCAQIARKCANGCRDRMQELKQEHAEFVEFAQAIQETWYTLRDSFNNGNPMEVTWTEEQPSLSSIRRAGAKAIRNKDPEEILAMVADCIDLSGGAAKDNEPADPPVCCRLTILMGANTRNIPIRQGISEGRILKLVTIADTYNEDSVRRAYALLKAREP